MAGKGKLFIFLYNFNMGRLDDQIIHSTPVQYFLPTCLRHAEEASTEDVQAVYNGTDSSLYLSTCCKDHEVRCNPTPTLYPPSLATGCRLGLTFVSFDTLAPVYAEGIYCGGVLVHHDAHDHRLRRYRAAECARVHLCYIFDDDWSRVLLVCSRFVRPLKSPLT